MVPRMSVRRSATRSRPLPRWSRHVQASPELARVSREIAPGWYPLRVLATESIGGLCLRKHVRAAGARTGENRDKQAVPPAALRESRLMV
jgi:hypothetical protein